MSRQLVISGGTCTIYLLMDEVVYFEADHNYSYVVFRDKDGKLLAIRASYSRLRGELRFETPLLGEFEIICFDFEGEEFSDAFYEALEEWIRTHG